MLTSGTLTTSDVPDNVIRLAEHLAAKHGDCIICREDHGIHIRIASPIGLELDGDRELVKKHLYVNADKYYAQGQWASRRGTYNRDLTAYCMKYEKAYLVSDLLEMPNLEARGIKPSGYHAKVTTVKKVRMVDDGKGNLVPPGPGKTIPLTQLDPEHPAVWYLKQRGYRLDLLEKQFGACWCYEEEPQSEEDGLYYKKLPGGFSITPQGRIIFHCYMEGVCHGYQGRIPEFVDEHGVKHYWHPYRNRWEGCETYNKETEKWEPLPHLVGTYTKWDMQKYHSGVGISRNNIMFGLDAAVEWNKRNNKKNPVGIVVEGPLDAGRFGPPAMPQLGKFLSQEQAKILARNFRRIIYIMDNDSAGKQAAKKAPLAFNNSVQLDIIEINEVSDPGSLSESRAWEIVFPFICRP